jgi:dTDP-4-dehydrorhamnose 3,5-epimerase
VAVREVRHVPRRGGALTEVFRRDWFDGEPLVDQIFQVVLDPGTVSAWHAHEFATDRLFVASGSMTLALFDSRPDSPTRGEVNEFRLGIHRPALVVVPPKVWHGVRAEGLVPAVLINAPDRAYRYDQPDHWRLAWDSSAIPYRFG